MEKATFRNLVYALDPRYSVPRRNTLSREVEKLFEHMTNAVKVHLLSATTVHFTTDIWSKRGMTSSYLGVTAHFFAQSDSEYHSVLLAVRHIEELHHTFDIIAGIFTEVVQEWGILAEKVGFVITDSGSNMVKAFRDDYFQQLVENERSEGDEENSEASMIGDEELDRTIDQDVSDFVALDEEIQTQFDEAGLGKRLSCYSHTLQLVVTSFNKDSFVKSLLKEVYQLVRKVNSSGVATGMLLNLCNKKLVSHCPTRWSSTFLVIQRLLEVKESFLKVMAEMKWDCTLTLSKWKVLSGMIDLLKPFAVSTTLLSGDMYSTIDSVVPDLDEILIHLDEFIGSEDSPSELIPVANQMKFQVTHRFSKIIDPGAVDCDPTYMMAMLLNPSEAILMTDAQVTCASTALKQYMKRAERFMAYSGTESPPSNRETTPPPDANGSSSSSNSHVDLEEPPTKRRRQERRQQRIDLLKKRENRANDPINVQVDRYVRKITQKAPQSNVQVSALKYWIDRLKSNRSPLAGAAVDILTAPASSAAAERVFSIASEITGGKRNRLQKRNLEREILLRRNIQYVPVAIPDNF